MLLACSRLLRRCRQGDLPHQLTGLALQSVSNSISADGFVSESLDNGSASLRIAESSTASTSSAWLPMTPFSQRTCSVRRASTSSIPQSARRRDILRDAAQKVPEGSSWLVAYSNNLQARQLTFRLGKRDKLQELAEGWTLYQQKFDTVAMAAMLRRIRTAQIRDPNFQLAEAQRLIAEQRPRLQSVTLRFGRLRDITAYLHALAKLSSPLPGPTASSATPDASSAAQQSLMSTHPTELILDLASFATRNRTEMLHSSPQRLATLLWALQRLLPEDSYGSEKLQVVLDRIALCSIQRLQNFAPLDMRIFALAYATFGPRPDKAAAGAAKGAAARGKGAAAAAAGENSPSAWPSHPKIGAAEAAEAPGAAGGADAAARRRSRNSKVVQAMADELAARHGNLAFPQPEPRDLVTAAQAVVLQGLPPHVTLTAKAAHAAGEALPTLRPEEVVQFVEALAAQGVRQPNLLQAVRKHSERWGATAEEGAEGTGELRARLAAAYKALGVAL